MSKTNASALPTLALYSIPITGQRALSRHPKEKVRAALASSPRTHISIINTLAADKSRWVRCLANRRTNDPDRLAGMVKEWSTVAHFDHGRSSMTLTARNRLLPSEMLIEMLNSDSSELAMGAYCNPSTPEKARQKLTPQRAEQIVADADSLAKISLRTRELVAANPWLVRAATARTWGKQMPEMYSAVFEARAAKKLGTKTVRYLLQLNTDQADIAALNKPEFNRTEARRMQRREWPIAEFVTERLVDRYGIQIMTQLPLDKNWWPKCETLAPALHFADADVMLNGQIPKICFTLGSNEQNWETFLNLLEDWHGTNLEAAKAACKL